jgi:hypothetical protein
MSIRVMTRIWEMSEQTGTKLLLLLALADSANDDGVCYPGVAYISRKARVPERTTQRLLHELVEEGELAIEFRSGRGQSNNYHILTGLEEVDRARIRARVNDENKKALAVNGANNEGNLAPFTGGEKSVNGAKNNTNGAKSELNGAKNRVNGANVTLKMPLTVLTVLNINQEEIPAEKIWLGLKQILENMLLEGNASPRVREIIRCASGWGWRATDHTFLVGLPSLELTQWANDHLASTLRRAIMGFACGSNCVEFVLLSPEVNR